MKRTFTIDLEKRVLAQDFDIEKLLTFHARNLNAPRRYRWIR